MVAWIGWPRRFRFLARCSNRGAEVKDSEWMIGKEAAAAAAAAATPAKGPPTYVKTASPLVAAETPARETPAAVVN